MRKTIFFVFLVLFIGVLKASDNQSKAQTVEQIIASLALEQFNQSEELVQMRSMNLEASAADVSYSAYDVTLVEQHDGWARIHIVSEPSVIYGENGEFHGILFQGAVAKEVNGNWQILFQGTKEFDAVKNALPIWLSFLSATPQADESITNFSVPALPTVIGDSKFSTLRFTQGPYGSHFPQESIDLAVLNTEDEPHNGFSLPVYAVDEGEIVKTITGSTCFSVIRPDGLGVWYQHVDLLDGLNTRTEQNAGSYVRMNDLIGNTTSVGSCGYVGAVPHHVHLTFFNYSQGNSLVNSINPVGSVLNDWTLVDNDHFQRAGVTATESDGLHLNDYTNWVFHKGCPDHSGVSQVRLFSGKNCTENPYFNIYYWDGRINLSTLNNGSWDNRIGSLKVSPGYAVKVWLNANDSQYACYDGDLWDLSKDYMPGTSSSFYKTISAIQVVEGTCSQIVNDPSCSTNQQVAFAERGTNLVANFCQPANPPPPDVAPPPAGPQDGDTVKLYSNAGYEGTVIFSGGEGFSNGPNAEGSSLRIPDGWSVVTYDVDNMQGNSRCWNNSVNNLQDHGWQSRTQSIQVYRGFNACPTEPPSAPDGVRLYDHTNYSGYLGTWGTGFHDHLQAPADSLRIPSGWSVFLYRWDKRQVKADCFNRDIPDLDKTGNWDNQIYGIEVFSDDMCQDDLISTHDYVVYTDEGMVGNNCGGHGPAVATDLTSWCGEDWNDRISSIRIKNGWSVKIWNHVNFEGGSVCFSHGYSTMRNDALNDGTSIAVYPPSNGDRDSVISSFAVFDNEHCDGSPAMPQAAWGYPEDSGNLAMGRFVSSAKGNNSQSVFVDWEPSPDSSIHGYRIYEHVDNSSYILLAEVDAYTTSWRYNNLPCSTDYQFVIHAYNQWGDSATPNLVSVSTPSCYVPPTIGGPATVYLPTILNNWSGNTPPPPSEGPTPSAPTNLRLTGTGQGSFSVVWNDNSSIETSYEVWYRDGRGIWINPSLPANTTSHTVTGLDCYAYDVMVRAVRHANGNVYYSESNFVVAPVDQCATSVVP